MSSVYGVQLHIFVWTNLRKFSLLRDMKHNHFVFYVSVDGNCCPDTLSSLSLSCSIWLIYSRCQCKFSNLLLVKFYTNEDLWAQTINKPGILKIMQNEENTGTNSFVSRHLYGIYNFITGSKQWHEQL